MQIVPEVEQSDLSTAYLPAIWVRIAFSRSNVIFRQCHFFIALESGGADLFRSGSGNSLERFASFNDVMLVEQVDEPPQVEADPEPPSTEVAEAPTKPISDDDIPF